MRIRGDRERSSAMEDTSGGKRYESSRTFSSSSLRHRGEIRERYEHSIPGRDSARSTYYHADEVPAHPASTLLGLRGPATASSSSIARVYKSPLDKALEAVGKSIFF